MIDIVESPAPMPFVVGVPRSGTTLLRLMLDAHPQLVMSPETSWLGGLIDHMTHAPEDRIGRVDMLMQAPNWGDMGIAPEALRALSEQAAPADFVRGLYRLYARRTPEKADVQRLGDKTPHNSLIMTKIASILPEARFIHIIRDGRDVAMSLKPLWFGPEKSPQAMASFWASRVLNARRQAQFLDHYMEVRFEDLVAEPTSVLSQIAEFIELPFDRKQLSYESLALVRMKELGDVKWADRTITAEMRRSVFQLTLSPPDTTRAERWRREMSMVDISKFESVAGDVLTSLGYPLLQGRQSVA